MEKIEIIKQYAEDLRLTRLKHHPESIIHQAQINKPSYLEFVFMLLEGEMLNRQKSALAKRLKSAKLPKNHDLDYYDFNHSNGLTKPELKELRELLWLNQNYNLILMGPSGTGYAKILLI